MPNLFFQLQCWLKFVALLVAGTLLLSQKAVDLLGRPAWLTSIVGLKLYFAWFFGNRLVVYGKHTRMRATELTAEARRLKIKTTCKRGKKLSKQTLARKISNLESSIVQALLAGSLFFVPGLWHASKICSESNIIVLDEVDRSMHHPNVPIHTVCPFPDSSGFVFPSQGHINVARFDAGFLTIERAATTDDFHGFDVLSKSGFVGGGRGTLSWFRPDKQSYCESDVLKFGPRKPIRAIWHSDDGERMATGGADGIRVWDTRTKMCLYFHPLAAGIEYADCGQFLPGSNTIMAVGYRARSSTTTATALEIIRFGEADSADVILAVPGKAVTDLAFSRYGSRLYFVDYGYNHISCLALKPGASGLESRLDKSLQRPVALTLHPTLPIVAIAQRTETSPLKFFETTDFKDVAIKIGSILRPHDYFYSLAFTNDGRLFVAVGENQLSYQTDTSENRESVTCTWRVKVPKSFPQNQFSGLTH